MKKNLLLCRCLLLPLLLVAQVRAARSGVPEEEPVEPPFGVQTALLSVTPTGAATYAIPIEVPRGSGGVQPALSIVYSSQAGNGLAGWGCTLSGISAITRAPRDIYHDSMAKGLTYSADEAYYLDGQRLIYSSGTPGQEGAIYYLESAPFTKVVVHGTSNATTANTWFEVQLTNGTIYRYGETANGRHNYNVGSSPKTHAWYLEYVEDVVGSHMSYAYYNDNNYMYLWAITYGANKHQYVDGQHAVYIDYEQRNDATPFVINGVAGKMRQRITCISVSSNNTYELTYNDTGDQTATKFSRLTSVTVKNAAGEAREPIVLNWNYLRPFQQSVIQPTVNAASSYPAVNFAEQQFISGDYNGDGLTDMVGIAPVKIPTGQNSWAYDTYAYVYYASLDASGKTQFISGRNYSLGTNEKWDDNWVHQHGGQSAIDYDGDGINEFLIPKLKITSKSKTVDFNIYGSKTNYVVQDNHLKNSSEMPCYGIGDFNKDGKGDIIYIEKGHSNNKYSGKVIGNVPELYADFELTLPSNPEKMFVADFDGNGMDDMLVFYNGGYTLFWNQNYGISGATFSDSYKVTGTNIGVVFEEEALPGIFQKRNSQVTPGDFNGDGLPDFLINAAGDNKWYFALNNGDGAFAKTLACTLEVYDQTFTEYDDDKLECFVYDFDLDGKSDVVITKAAYTRESNWLGQVWGNFDKTYTYWMRSTGTSLVQVSMASSNREDDGRPSRYVLGDFNGDGQVELMNYGYSCYNSINANSDPTWRLYKNSMTVSDGKLAYVADGYGNDAIITYASLLSGGIYTKGTGGTYPLVDLAVPLHMVKSTAVRNGIASALLTNYEYGGLKAHLQGRGILGMSWQKAHNTTLDVATESGVSAWSDSFYIPSKTYTKTTVDGKTAEASVTMSIVEKGNKKYFAYPLAKIEKDLDGNTVSTSYKFNHDHGYPLHDSTSYGNGMYRATRYDSYTRTAGGYKPYMITVAQKHSDDDKPFVQKTYMEYDFRFWGFPGKKVENYGSPKSLTTEYISRDVVGNVLEQKVSGSGIPTTTYHTEYDASKRFVTKAYATATSAYNGSTQPASTVSSFTYDSRGNLLTEKEETYAYGTLTTTHTYNSWDGRTSTTLPDGRKTTYSWGWDAGKYHTLTRAAGQPWVKTWCDQKGRETLVETVGAKGMPIQRQTTYNRKGQVESTQTQTGDITTTESYTYDARGRLKTSSNSAGKNTNYDYGNRSTTTTVSGGGSYTTSYDAWGSVKTATDPEGTIAYAYSSLGKPRSITTGGATFTMEYDEVGNQTKLVDPNAGVLTYAHDAAGRVTRQVNARGKVTGYRYDTRGRLAADTVDGVVTYYNYGTSGQDRWPSEVGSGAGVRYYTYDKSGRVLTEDWWVYMPEEEADFNYTYRYTYNALGQLSSTVYPSGLVATREYDEYGHLIKALSEGQPVWELTGATGTSTTARLGEDITTTQTYDSNGLLNNQSARANSTILQNWSYGFNGATGNLAYRSNVQSQQREDFEYDNLDRLTTVKLNGTPAMSIGYDPNGNISSKTGLGKYSYAQSEAGVHALTEVENTDGLISSENQAILYTGFNKVASIGEKVGSDSLVLSFDYTPSQQRWRTVLKRNGTTVRTIFFAGDYEKIVEGDTTTELTYLPGGAMHVRQNGYGGRVLYTHTNHLGSIVSITEGNGTEVFKASYDAWGQQTVTSSAFKFHRGYTGHEHLPEFGLINMNARLYDPQLGRMLSPDPYVVDAGYSQDFNRYSYARNNPLIYTDPNGEWIHLVIGAAIGGTINWLTNGAQFNWQGLGYFGIGAAAGALGAGMGAGVSSAMAGGGFGAGFIGGEFACTATSSFLSGAAIGGSAGFSSGFVGGFGNGLMQNQSFGEAAWSGTKVGLIAGTSGALVGGLAGGIDAYRQGRDFWNGNPWETIVDYSLPNGNLPNRQQANPEVGCTQEVIESFNEYFGGQPISLDKSQGADFTELTNQLCDNNEIGFSSTRVAPNLRAVGRELTKGHPSAITYNNGETMHTVGLNRIRIQQVARAIGSGFRTRTMIEVMNPLYSNYQNLSLSLFRSSVIRLAIPY